MAHLTAPQANYQHEEKGDALHAMELALSLEKLNFHKLRELHDIADASHDAQMADFVEDMLAEQVCDLFLCIPTHHEACFTCCKQSSFVAVGMAILPVQRSISLAASCSISLMCLIAA